jgi:uncharacterized membrane protein
MLISSAYFSHSNGKTYYYHPVHQSDRLVTKIVCEQLLIHFTWEFCVWATPHTFYMGIPCVSNSSYILHGNSVCEQLLIHFTWEFHVWATPHTFYMGIPCVSNSSYILHGNSVCEQLLIHFTWEFCVWATPHTFYMGIPQKFACLLITI